MTKHVRENDPQQHDTSQSGVLSEDEEILFLSQMRLKGQSKMTPEEYKQTICPILNKGKIKIIKVKMGF